MKSTTVSFRVSFRIDDFHLGELYPHLLSMKSEMEAANEIKRILSSGKRLEKHNKFPCDEFELPKIISFRMYIGDRDIWLHSLREKFLTHPPNERAFLLKKMIFDIYSKKSIGSQNSGITPNMEGENSKTSINNKENTPNETIENSISEYLSITPRQTVKTINSEALATPYKFQIQGRKIQHKVIAIDVGHSNTKTVWSHGLDKNQKEIWGEACFKSIAPKVLVSEEDGVSVNPNRILIKINGRKYYAGPAASIGIEPRVLDPNYIESDEHEALIRASLHLMMRSNHQVIEKIDMMVLGLPVSSFTFQKKKLLEIALLPREVPVPLTLQRNGAPSTVIVKAEKAIIFPQAYGGLRYAAQEISKDDVPFFDNSLCMVIDPGYKTFDWFISRGMLPEIKLSGSFDGGVSSILRQVSQKIGFDHGTGSLEFDQIEDGLNTGAINLGYKVIDTNPYKSLVLDASRKEIVSFLARIDSNKTRLSRVFLTGGGASFYIQALKEKLPSYHIQTLSNPVMGNARGYWLSGFDLLQI